MMPKESNKTVSGKRTAGKRKPKSGNANEQRDFGRKIREIRERSGLGTRIAAAEKLGFNKNTLASYETALSLPDIDFLVVFSDRTGVSLSELLRLRLQVSRYPAVRALSGRFAAKPRRPATTAGAETEPETAELNDLPPQADQPPWLSNRRERYAQELMEPIITYSSSHDLSVLEAALRAAEGRLKGPLTLEVADNIDHLVTAWRSVATGSPELAERLERIRTAAALLRPEA